MEEERQEKNKRERESVCEREYERGERVCVCEREIVCLSEKERWIIQRKCHS